MALLGLWLRFEEIKSKGLPVAFVGDVVGTGSSQKISHLTQCSGSSVKICPAYPNKRSGGICIGSKVAPIFFNTMEDAGALGI
jgi:aconitate hydratase 2/2-methylisocitrate dehydratase